MHLKCRLSSVFERFIGVFLNFLCPFSKGLPGFLPHNSYTIISPPLTEFAKCSRGISLCLWVLVAFRVEYLRYVSTHKCPRAFFCLCEQRLLFRTPENLHVKQAIPLVHEKANVRTFIGFSACSITGTGGKNGSNPAALPTVRLICDTGPPQAPPERPSKLPLNHERARRPHAGDCTRCPGGSGRLVLCSGRRGLCSGGPRPFFQGAESFS